MQAMATINAPMTPAAVMPMLCPEWVVLDIETQGGDPAQVWEWIRRNWWPSEDWKPETMAKRLVEAVAKKREKLALLDSAEIVMVQLKTALGVQVIHAFGDRVSSMPGVVACQDERQLLACVASWFGQNCGEGTTLVGWNINGFDLPRLRLRMARAGLALPPAFMGLCGVLDLMNRWAWEFSVERSEFVALGDALEALGMVNHKKDVNGAMVGELIERGELVKLIEYGITDVNQEAEIFLRMTGRG